jgi:hypothetical protein
MKAQAIFLHLFIVCSSSKWKFVVYPFIDEETNGSCPFANGLNGPAHLRTCNISTIHIDICIYIGRYLYIYMYMCPFNIHTYTVYMYIHIFFTY